MHPCRLSNYQAHNHGFLDLTTKDRYNELPLTGMCPTQSGALVSKRPISEYRAPGLRTVHMKVNFCVVKTLEKNGPCCVVVQPGEKDARASCDRVQGSAGLSDLNAATTDPFKEDGYQLCHGVNTRAFIRQARNKPLAR